MRAKFDLSRLQIGLRNRFLGKTMFFSKNVPSTNDWAEELARFGAFEGTVVVAVTQTRGRGRLHRKWVSPDGGLWFSVIFRPKLSARDAHKLTFVAGVAVAETLREMYGLKTETKWPNDVSVDGRKICGILGKANASGGKVDFVILGIGVNANFDPKHALPKSLREKATSLENELGRRVRLEKLLAKLLEKLEETYDIYAREGFNTVLEKWKGYACFLGHEVELSDKNLKIKGLACGVNQDGALVLRLEDGNLANIVTGDVSMRSDRGLRRH